MTRRRRGEKTRQRRETWRRRDGGRDEEGARQTFSGRAGCLCLGSFRGTLVPVGCRTSSHALLGRGGGRGCRCPASVHQNLQLPLLNVKSNERGDQNPARRACR
eukprot:357319-Hanusia_phi.AAC.4